MPLSWGPILFFASGPMAWQPRHLEKDISPAAASCAKAGDEAAHIGRPTKSAAIRRSFVLFS
jgi:hypothetical protein